MQYSDTPETILRYMSSTESFMKSGSPQADIVLRIL